MSQYIQRPTIVFNITNMSFDTITQHVFTHILADLLGYVELKALLYVSRAISKKVDKTYLQSRKWWNAKTFDYEKKYNAHKFINVDNENLHHILQYVKNPTHLRFADTFKRNLNTYKLYNYPSIIELRFKYEYMNSIIKEFPPNLQILCCTNFNISDVKHLPKSLRKIEFIGLALPYECDVAINLKRCLPQLKSIMERSPCGFVNSVITFDNLELGVLFKINDDPITYDSYINNVSRCWYSPQEIFDSLPHTAVTEKQMELYSMLYENKISKIRQ